MVLRQPPEVSRLARNDTYRVVKCATLNKTGSNAVHKKVGKVKICIHKCKALVSISFLLSMARLLKARSKTLTTSDLRYSSCNTSYENSLRWYFSGSKYETTTTRLENLRPVRA